MAIMFTKTLESWILVQKCLAVLREPDNHEDHHAAVIYDCFEAAGIVPLAALVVAEGSASDNAFRILHMVAPAWNINEKPL